MSIGGGLVISYNGYRLANYHVVANIDEVIVRFSNRRGLKAKVIGCDEANISNGFKV